MFIFDRLKTFLSNRLVMKEIKSAHRIIRTVGGPDIVIMSYVKQLNDSPELRLSLRNGQLSPSDYPMPRSLVSIASIECLMTARRRLVDNPRDENALNILEIAQYALKMSFLHLVPEDLAHLSESDIQKSRELSLMVLHETDDADLAFSAMPQRVVADEKLKIAEKALENWLNADLETYHFEAYKIL